MSVDPARPRVFSPIRHRLCSREHAVRIAAQICDEADVHVAVIRSRDPIQPYRVGLVPVAEGEVIEIEIRK